jgi:hypothetical protein
MVKAKPPCPRCGETKFVKTQGGGSLGMYRYSCRDATCQMDWQQVPPHRTTETTDAKISIKKTRKSHKASAASSVAPSDAPADQSFSNPLEPVSEAAVLDDSGPPLALYSIPRPFAEPSRSRASLSGA